MQVINSLYVSGQLFELTMPLYYLTSVQGGLHKRSMVFVCHASPNQYQTG
jgi:hypothetical protein